jgi:hypothetical protein
MLHVLDGYPDGVVAVRGTGTVTADDYRRVLGPAVETATAGGRKARLLLELTEGFEGYDASAIAADAGLGMGHLGSFERIAVVTDAEWLRGAVHVFGAFIPGEVRLFAAAESADAEAWIRG